MHSEQWWTSGLSWIIYLNKIHWKNQVKDSDHVEQIIDWASEHFLRQTAEVSESALYEAHSNGNCRRPIKAPSSKTPRVMGSSSQVRLRNKKGGFPFHRLYSMSQSECQLGAGYSILPVWHTEWAFQRQTWEENVCSCTVRQPPQRAPFCQNTGCSDRGWTMKIMTQMADKDRPCTLSLFSSPHPSLFSIFKAPPGWRKLTEAGARREGGRKKEEGSERGTASTGKLWQPGEEQTGFESNLQATGWRRGGWGWVRKPCSRHGDNQ